jgi:hypothetical protein
VAAVLDEVAESAVASARSAMVELAALEQCTMHDLACTLIVVAIAGDRAAVAHIGDGAAVALTRYGLVLLSAPGESEYTNEVVPLSSESWAANLRVTSTVGGVECVAVLTDGCQRAAFLRNENGPAPYERFFHPLFSFAKELIDTTQGEEELRGLLSSKKVCENAEDDKTLVLAVLRDE